jgi:hypothetical protein
MVINTLNSGNVMKYKIIFTVVKPSESVLYWSAMYPEKINAMLIEIYDLELMFAHYNSSLTSISAEDICYFVDEQQANSYLAWRTTDPTMIERNTYDTENETTRSITFSGYVDDSDIPNFARRSA